jgi:ribonuclease Z
MKPIFQPHLVNSQQGDPVLYVDFLFGRRALLFDLGDVSALSARKLLRVSDVFVSHTHMDHFMDFDRLLRLMLGRDKRIRVFGPEGIIDRVQHKLAAYTWNLVENYETSLIVEVTELCADNRGHRALFRCHRGFAREDHGPLRLAQNVLIEDAAIKVRAAVLDHSIPCLGYVVEEKRHVNIWKNRLLELNLPVGPWLNELKQAVLTGKPDETPVRIGHPGAGMDQDRYMSLGELKARVLRIVPGQKIGYITDIVYHLYNARRVIELVRDADVLFIEACFMQEDAEIAAQKFHLTARQAGSLAQQADVKRVVACHISPRYAGREQELLDEVNLAAGN